MKPNLVYFVRPIGLEGPIKIGCSAKPASRLEMLMLWSPFPLEVFLTIPGDLKLEARVHAAFWDLHTHREWFRPAPRLLDFIAKLSDGTSIGDLIDLSVRPRSRRIGKKRDYSDGKRQYLSYAARVRNAFAPLWKPDNTARFAPKDVQAILDRWRRTPDVLPSQIEFDRLEAAIKSPPLHAVTGDERWSRIPQSKLGPDLYPDPATERASA